MRSRSSRKNSLLKHDHAQGKRRGNFSRLWIEQKTQHITRQVSKFLSSATRPFAPFLRLFYATAFRKKAS